MSGNILHVQGDTGKYPVELDFPATGKYKMQLNARRIVGQAGDTQLILLAMENATDHGGNK